MDKSDHGVHASIRLFEDDFYCETCGYAEDELHFNYNADSDGLSWPAYEIDLSVGCYNGDSLSTMDRAEAIEFLRQAAQDYPYAKSEILELIEEVF